MKTVGFIKSDKERENRIAICPEDANNIKNIEYIFIENGYGMENGYSDEEYLKCGFNVVSRNEAMKKDIIVDPKIGDAKYLKELKNKIIFGWIHAVQNKNITDIILENNLNAYAWEDMFENERHVFWRNNEIAGESAVLHALLSCGEMPYNCNVAIIGNGNTSRGAYKILSKLGANIKVYNRKMEKLLQDEIENYDIIVNAVLWDVKRSDHIIYSKDLKRMKKDALIIDVSCDHNGAIESSHPTTIEHPVYVIDGIKHYAVDHTPSIFYKTVSKELSKEVVKYLDFLIEEKENDVLNKSNIINNGKIIDKKILEYQKR